MTFNLVTGIRISAGLARVQKLSKEQRQSSWIFFVVIIISKILECIVVARYVGHGHMAYKEENAS